MMKNKTAYPLSLSKAIAVLREKFRSLTFQNNDIIAEVENPNDVLNLRYLEDENFYFMITNPSLTGDFRPFFNFKYFPENENNSTNTGYNNELPVILEHFENWITLLRAYQDLTWDEETAFTKAYEEEFFTDFEILDDDAATAPFDHQRQVLIFELLDYVIKKLNENKIEDTDISVIITDSYELRDNIQNLSKQNAVRKLSSIFAKIKKKGLALLLEIINEAKKEMIKRALTGGIDDLISFVHRLK
ncbi:hypothetical protein [Mucilaginibacter sp.]|uniref:hypothetical protein n=1 Tax=Mucilaginibacter sp. TaxID=1882438 RepID=UPI003D0B82A0